MTSSLNDIGMVAAETERTLAYLRELEQCDLLPNYILILENRQRELRPGQVRKKYRVDIENILRKAKVEYEISPSDDINSDLVINMLLKRPENIFIFSGFGGVLLKDGILSIGKKFLHVHGGFIPDYKGSTANYFSLLLENSIGASAIFLTRELDSGPILWREKFAPPKDRSQMDHGWDCKVRSIVLAKVLRSYKKLGYFVSEPSSLEEGETFFIIHPVLKHLAILDNDERY